MLLGLGAATDIAVFLWLSVRILAPKDCKENLSSLAWTKEHLPFWKIADVTYVCTSCTDVWYGMLFYQKWFGGGVGEVVFSIVQQNLNR